MSKINYHSTASLNLKLIRKNLLREIAGLYYDMCVTRAECYSWRAPLEALLGYLCKGDLPRYLAETQELIYQTRANAAKNTSWDSDISRALFKITAALFAKELAAAWKMSSVNDCLSHVHSILFTAWEVPRRISAHKASAKLYHGFAQYKSHDKAGNLADIESSNDLIAFFPPLHEDTNPITIIKLVNLLSTTLALHFTSEIKRTDRYYFICLYQQVEALNLEDQLQRHFIEKQHYLDLISTTAEKHSLCSRLRLFDKKPCSLSETEEKTLQKINRFYYSTKGLVPIDGPEEETESIETELTTLAEDSLSVTQPQGIPQQYSMTSEMNRSLYFLVK